VVRKWFRKAADKSEIIEPFIDFIPNMEYTSVICAGLKFILKACAVAKQFRDETFDLIENLPEKIDIVSQYSELYSTDSKLQLVTNQLYSDILWVIEGIVFWLIKDHTFEFLKPFLLQGSCYAPLKGRIAGVRKSSVQVEMVVKLCDSKKLSKIGDTVEVNNAALKNIIMMLMRSHFQNAEWFAKIYKCHAAEESQEPQHISPKELLLLLSPNTTDQTTSLELASRNSTLARVLGFSMNKEDQIRAEWLMANKKVSSWFRSAQSHTILVNGNHTLDRISPVSFFCAMLVQSLKSIESIMVLCHFCGLYTPEDRPVGEPPGSCGLLRSLLTQLIEQWDFGELKCLNQGDVEKLKSASPNLSLQDQRHLFRRLVKALPPTKPLFIIIDNINYYETDEFYHETKKVIRRLLPNSKIKAMVKIFVTSATRATEVNRCFKQSEMLNMPVDMDGTRLGFADMKFDRQFGPKIEKLDHLSSREPA